MALAALTHWRDQVAPFGAVVGECNDELAEAFYADGHDLTTMRDHRQRVRTFLRAVIAGTSDRVTHPQMA